MSHLRAYRSAGGRYVPLFHSVKRGDAVVHSLDSLRVINRNQKRSELDSNYVISPPCWDPSCRSTYSRLQLSIRVFGLDGSELPHRAWSPALMRHRLPHACTDFTACDAM